MTKIFWTKSTANFGDHLPFFPKHIFPYPRRLASHNSMVKKDDKMGNKSRNRKGKERERPRKKDPNRFAKKSKFYFIHKRQKQK